MYYAVLALVLAKRPRSALLALLWRGFQIVLIDFGALHRLIVYASVVFNIRPASDAELVWFRRVQAELARDAVWASA